MVRDKLVIVLQPDHFLNRPHLIMGDLIKGWTQCGLALGAPSGEFFCIPPHPNPNVINLSDFHPTMGGLIKG